LAIFAVAPKVADCELTGTRPAASEVVHGAGRESDAAGGSGDVAEFPILGGGVVGGIAQRDAGSRERNVIKG